SGDRLGARALPARRAGRPFALHRRARARRSAERWRAGPHGVHMPAHRVLRRLPPALSPADGAVVARPHAARHRVARLLPREAAAALWPRLLELLEGKAA